MKARRQTYGAALRASFRRPRDLRSRRQRAKPATVDRSIDQATVADRATIEDDRPGKGRRIGYSPEELAWLEANRPQLPIGELHLQFCEIFGRNVSADALGALCLRKGWLTGRTGCFEKGSVPANKGKTMPYNANSAATRFKKGERRGVAVKLYKPIGSERLSKEGFLERKIHDGLPLQSRWRAVHLIHWETIHGRVPEGMALKCLDTDRTNTDPSNWALISRAVLLRLNGGPRHGHLAYDLAHPELRPAILATAKLATKASTARRTNSKAEVRA
jgi:hypothetical protein